MSDESVVTQHANAESGNSTRVPRREALKGLGALAVSTTAIAAGCSTEMMMGDSGGAASPPASGMSATSTPSSTSAATMTTSPAASAATSGMAKPGATMASAPTVSTSGAAAPTAASGGAAGMSASAAAPGGTPAMAAASAAGAPATAASGMGSAAGSGSAAAMSSATDLSSLACILSPEMTEGPFFVEEKLNRSDLLMGESDELITKAVPLKLVIGVYKVDGMACMPLPGLQVDIWHANAHGEYSDVASGFIQSVDTKGKKFLRGYQVTGETGIVEFATIYPGWYPSRTIHIHFKIRMPMGGNSAYDFTSQMFFEESTSKEVLAMAPYSSTPGTRMIFNDDDHIYNGTQMNGQKPPSGQKAPGLDTVVALNKMGNGYVGTLKIGLKI